MITHLMQPEFNLPEGVDGDLEPDDVEYDLLGTAIDIHTGKPLPEGTIEFLRQKDEFNRWTAKRDEGLWQNVYRFEITDWGSPATDSWTIANMIDNVFVDEDEAITELEFYMSFDGSFFGGECWPESLHALWVETQIAPWDARL